MSVIDRAEEAAAVRQEDRAHDEGREYDRPAYLGRRA